MYKSEPIGIDFGTTKSLLAYHPQRGSRRIVVRHPTAVRFKTEQTRNAQEALVGAKALAENPAYAWKSFKLAMGKPVVPAGFRDAPLPPNLNPPEPTRLAAILFYKMRLEFLSKEFNLDKPPDDLLVGPVTITVPAEWDFAQRQATIFAAHVAGFRDIRILEEPVAAFLMHYYNRRNWFDTQSDLLSLVIDFGGGTCDMALIKSQPYRTPFVQATRTVRVGGRNIDDAIVARWLRDNRLGIKLPEQEELPEGVSYILSQWARKSKERINPDREEDLQNVLLHPMDSLRSSDNVNDVYERPGELSIASPELTKADLEIIMSGYLQKIKVELDVLRKHNGPQDIQHVILVGGSSYLRQFIAFVVNEFKYLLDDKRESQDRISFAEPDTAIAYGALEYQKDISGGHDSITPTQPLSTYLMLDYNPEKDLSPQERQNSSISYIAHKGKFFIELGKKGDAVSKDLRPRLVPPAAKVLHIPLPSTRRLASWEIYQIRRRSEDDEDYSAIEPGTTDPIDFLEIAIPRLNRWLQPLKMNLISLVYRFNVYGDFYRHARAFTALSIRWGTQHDKLPNFDWRDRGRVDRARDDFIRKSKLESQIPQTGA